MLVSTGDPSSISQTARRRGEHDWTERQPRSRGPEIDVSHLFHGHELEPDSRFLIRDDSKRSLEATIELTEQSTPTSTPTPIPTSTPTPTDPPMDDEEELSESEDEFEGAFQLCLAWSAPGEVDTRWHGTLTPRGGISENEFRKKVFPFRNGDVHPVQVITTAALSPEEVVALFEDVVLTPEEAKVVEALQTIDPCIQRIAPKSTHAGRWFTAQRGGMFVKCAGIDRPLPIGTMGDGIWRMLGLALTLAKSEGGVLLVDEIDTGLHYTVMDRMWTLVAETAHRLNVQVFATSHSRDCFESLAVIAPSVAEHGIDVSVQRLEAGKTEAVAYSEEQMLIAARRGLEVR